MRAMNYTQGWVFPGRWGKTGKYREKLGNTGINLQIWEILGKKIVLLPLVL
jgi:hypothetical protein